jgi:hypothetical protein
MIFHKGFDRIPDFETTSLSIVSQQLRPHPLVATTHQGLTTAAQGRQHDLGTRHWDDPRQSAETKAESGPPSRHEPKNPTL